MATSRIITNRVDSGAGAGFQISDCATQIYMDQDGKTTRHPTLKRACLRAILGVDDSHILTNGDRDKVGVWYSQNVSNITNWVTLLIRGWETLHFTGKTVGEIPEHDPGYEGEPDTGSQITDSIANIANLLGNLAGNPLAVLAIMVGFPMIAFGIYKGLQ